MGAQRPKIFRTPQFCNPPERANSKANFPANPWEYFRLFLREPTPANGIRKLSGNSRMALPCGRRTLPRFGTFFLVIGKMTDARL